jgi:hypothetical protein
MGKKYMLEHFFSNVIIGFNIVMFFLMYRIQNKKIKTILNTVHISVNLFWLPFLFSYGYDVIMKLYFM